LFKATLMETTMSKLGALLARKSLKKLNPESYNGAGLLGLKGLVFKSHGGANAYALSNGQLNALSMRRNIMCKSNSRHDRRVDARRFRPGSARLNH
jgi:fatty acid/phospholipid biosynthesis enzyme